MKKEEEFFSHGKLMISGEYFVLDGALSFSLPTKLGQNLEVYSSEKNIHWKSFDEKKNLWIDAVFDNELNLISNQKGDISILKKILNEVINLKPDFLGKIKNKTIHTNLDFPIDWGLGASSTLINNISNWANISPFLLLEKTIGGSGYDIATAKIETPCLFSLIHRLPVFQGTLFDVDFKENLFFIHLDKKQNSQSEIKKYSQIKKDKTCIIQEITKLSTLLTESKNLLDFENIIFKLENITSDFLEQETIKKKLFSDFNGAIKSLGAWGGDFILATGKKDYVKNYFSKRNFSVILEYNYIIL